MRRFFAFLVVFFIVNISFGQFYFSRLLETPYPYVGAIWGAIETPDSGFILMHTSLDIFQDTNKINIVKIDKKGETVWERAYGAEGTAHDQLEIIRTSDSCYVFCGGEWLDSIYSAFLFKINENGDSIWMKTYNKGFYYGFFNKVVETSNKDLICIGSFDRTPINGGDPWRQIYVVRTDKDGNLKWQREYGSFSLNDNGRDIVETPEGDFICSGYVRYPYITPGFFVRGVVMKIDSLGKVLWIKEYSKNEYYQAFIEINRTLDGNYLISGDYTNNRYILTNDPNGAGGILLKIDGNGNDLWFKQYGDEVFDAGFYDFVELPDGNFITIGFNPSGRSTMVRFNSSGDIVSKEQYRHNKSRESYEALFKIIHTEDNGFFMCGHGFSSGLSGSIAFAKGWVLKVDSLGCMLPLCVTSTEDEFENLEVIVYPNPFVEHMWVKLPDAHDYHTLRIYDITGRLVYSLDLSGGLAENFIDASMLDRGIYMMEFLSDTHRSSKKIIKLE